MLIDTYSFLEKNIKDQYNILLCIYDNDPNHLTRDVEMKFNK